MFRIILNTFESVYSRRENFFLSESCISTFYSTFFSLFEKLCAKRKSIIYCFKKGSISINIVMNINCGAKIADKRHATFQFLKSYEEETWCNILELEEFYISFISDLFFLLHLFLRIYFYSSYSCS